MDRSGWSTMNGTDSLGVRSVFRSMVCRLVEACVQKDKWFGFCTRVSKEQVDLMSIAVSESNGFTEKLSGQATLEYPNNTYRTAVYMYLIRDFLCYYEAPTVYRNNTTGGYNDSYNKCLITANLNVIAEWLGISYEEADRQYGFRLSSIWGDGDESDLCPYMKLYVTKEGVKKITKPRKDLDLSIKGTRVIPVFALKHGVDCLYKKAMKDFYNVTFVKDNGQPRTVNICFDLGKLRSVYLDNGKLVDEYDKQYKGDFMNVKTLERGYIRVIEVGTNLSCGATRSINFARIIGIEKAEPDVTFINTDLDRVVDTFVDCINSIKTPVKDILEMMEVFGVYNSGKGAPIKNIQELENYVRSQEMLLSTPFVKQLSLFMTGNPQWFNGYTGDDSPKKVETPISSNGEIPLDFDDFELVFDP